MEILLHIPLTELVRTAGYLGIFAMAFLESGIPFGFIFPGDSLMFTAGLVASQGYLAIVPLVFVATLGAILGDSAGYWLGSTFGPKLFSKKDALFLNQKYLVQTEAFFKKHGVKAIVLARFVPVVRTFTPIFAGMGHMQYRTFLTFNIIGALLWGTGLPLLGYTLGKSVPGIEHAVTWIVAAILVLSVLPIVFEVVRARQATKKQPVPADTV